MKKTAIVSCYFIHNYGSMLQAYATQKILDKYNVPNETINVSGFLRQYRKDQYAYILKGGFRSALFQDRLGKAKNLLTKKLAKNSYTRNIKNRDAEFVRFADTYIRKSNIYESIDVLSNKCDENYNNVLIGSDQLWLPANIAAKYYTLNFVPDHINRVSYATSFGVSSLPKDIEECARSFLSRIHHISVREIAGQKIVKDLTDRDVPVVCDPTLLFTGDEWKDIQKSEPIVEEPYIFCYFIGDNVKHREFAGRLKQKTGMKIVALTHIDKYIKNDEGYADETPFDIGPGDFLNLIRYSSYICTDSFHCSVFSILYKKEFYVFHRYREGSEMSTNSRLETLLKAVGISDRMLQGNEIVNLSQRLDYEPIYEKLERLRENSIQYLKSSLHMQQ